jgi:hypothetical protein
MTSVAGQFPDRLRTMCDILAMEATRNQVYPLDMSTLTRMIDPRPAPPTPCSCRPRAA